MTVLIADVGGTNTRLALVIDGAIIVNSIAYFSNNEFETFYDVIRTYLDHKSNPSIQTCIIAVAGPVSANSATLTNRNWKITIDKLKSIAKCQNALLINDLSSLGYAITSLPSSGVKTVWEGQRQPKVNTQYLVIGIGTGFNVCSVKADATERPICLQAEVGHIAMPETALAYLDKETASKFTTIEDVFSGRGLSNLHAALTNTDPLPGQAIAQQHEKGSDALATETFKTYAKMLAVITRELLLMYMPSGGIYFAGSVGRGIFNASMDDYFLEILHQPHFIEHIKNIPVHVISEDGAGLTGCAVLAHQL